jgi:endonuclease/exonuclease/phosphatase family metal-dependent hydrolase
MKIRVATYNIHKGVSSIRSTPRVLALKKAIAEFGADVVFLQEVQGRHDRYAGKFGHESRGHRHWPDASQHEYLADDAHEHSAYGMNAVYDHGHHGNALLSSFPIENSHNHDVSDHAYEQRGILHCVINTETCPIHCFVVHLGLFESGRGRQTQALIDCVNASAPNGEPVIIAGDFNDWRNTLSDKLRNALGVVEVFDELGKRSKIGDLMRNLSGREKIIHPARTFPAALPWFRLDRIYVRGFKVDAAHVLHGTLWAKLSDHAPIVANLKLA